MVLSLWSGFEQSEFTHSLGTWKGVGDVTFYGKVLRFAWYFRQETEFLLS